MKNSSRVFKYGTILKILTILVSNTYAQVNYDEIRSKIFYGTKIDTVSEKTLIIEKKYAIIYLKQSDVLSRVRQSKKYLEENSFRTSSFENIESLLPSNKKSIKMTDWWWDFSDLERVELFGSANYENEDKKYLDEIIFICADLMHDNLAMIYNKVEGRFENRRMKMKRVKGLFETRYVVFRFSGGKIFWRVLTRLGE